MLEVKFFKDGEEYKPTPIEVAIMLIQKKEKRRVWKNPFLGFLPGAQNAPKGQTMKIETEMFQSFELEEIAGHLSIYAVKYGCPMSMKDDEDGGDSDE